MRRFQFLCVCACSMCLLSSGVRVGISRGAADDATNLWIWLMHFIIVGLSSLFSDTENKRKCHRNWHLLSGQRETKRIHVCLRNDTHKPEPGLNIRDAAPILDINNNNNINIPSHTNWLDDELCSWIWWWKMKVVVILRVLLQMESGIFWVSTAKPKKQQRSYWDWTNCQTSACACL